MYTKFWRRLKRKFCNHEPYDRVWCPRHKAYRVACIKCGKDF